LLLSKVRSFDIGYGRIDRETLLADKYFLIGFSLSGVRENCRYLPFL